MLTSAPPTPADPAGLDARPLPFVLLWHEVPPGGGSASHFDLLITPPTPFSGADAGRLWAARVPAGPEEWRRGADLPLEVLPPHRAEYLAYEGELSGGRGRVRRVLAGRAFALQWGAERMQLTLEWPATAEHGAGFVQADISLPAGAPAKMAVCPAALELTILGSGTSTGVPLIGCACAVCRSPDPRNRRLRASALLRHADAQERMRVHLLDTAPDLRQQTLREAARLERLDTVFYTHAHADHIFGLDDLRRFNAVMGGQAIPFHAEARVVESLRRMFAYVFDPHKNVNQSYVAQLIPLEARAGEPFEAHGARWTPIRLLHGRLPIVGWRVDCRGKSLAYCTDVSAIPPESWEPLSGLDVLVLGALRDRHHPTHFTIGQALEVVLQLAPGQAYLTHMGHEVDYADLAAALPPGVAPACDGLRVVL